MENKKLEKPSESIVKAIIKSLKRATNRRKDFFEKSIEKIKTAKNINSIMCEKRLLLSRLVKTLPTAIGSCYFCLEGRQSRDFSGYCTYCNYGMEFGNCIEEEDSVYHKIIEARGALVKVITSYWFKDSAQGVSEMENKRWKKPNKDIVKQIVRAFKKAEEEDNRFFGECIREIENAKNIDSIMYAKRDLLANLAINLPLDSASCYFCHQENERTKNFIKDCVPCEYGKEFGMCTYDGDAVYGKILSARSHLLGAIMSYWYGRQPRRTL